MSVSTNIADGSTGRTASVSSKNALSVTDIPPDLPKRGVKNTFTFYNVLVGSSGSVETGLVNANMNVDGGTTSQVFYIGAEEDVDIRMMSLTIIIADSAIVHSNFGNVAALTNGFDIQVSEGGSITNVVSKIKTGGQFIAASGMSNAYGNTATSFELTNWTGTTDAQTIFLPLSSVVPGGIRLAAGTDDRLIATVNDDLTGLTEFTIRVTGYRHH